MKTYEQDLILKGALATAPKANESGGMLNPALLGVSEKEGKEGSA